MYFSSVFYVLKDLIALKTPGGSPYIRMPLSDQCLRVSMSEVYAVIILYRHVASFLKVRGRGIT